MSKAKAFEYVQVPLAIVATDLTGAPVEVEGAYFRVARLLAINGPMTLAVIREWIGTVTTVERLLDHRSTDVEPVLSFSWLEEWRERANAARARLSNAGRVSAEKRAKKKKGKNTSTTSVEHKLNSSSTNVEHATILSSTILSSGNGSEKEHASARLSTGDPDFDSLWKLYDGYGSKGKAFAYWQRLPQIDRDAILLKAGPYTESTPGCEYRKQLEGWINPENRLWERPIVKKGSQTSMRAALHSADVPPDAYEE